MANPNSMFQGQVTVNPGTDLLQIKNAHGTVISWIDSTGTAQGNLAGGGGNAGSLQSTTTTLTAAQVKGLVETTVNVVPAPGVGKFLNIISVTLVYKFGTQAFGNINGSSLTFTLGATGPSISSFGATGILDQTANTFSINLQTANPTDPTSTVDNQPLILGTDNASDYTNGTGSTLAVTTLYQVITE